MSAKLELKNAANQAYNDSLELQRIQGELSGAKWHVGEEMIAQAMDGMIAEMKKLQTYIQDLEDIGGKWL